MKIDLTGMELKVLAAETRSNLEGAGTRGSSLREYTEDEIPVIPYVESLYAKLEHECHKHGFAVPTLAQVNREIEEAHL